MLSCKWAWAAPPASPPTSKRKGSLKWSPHQSVERTVADLSLQTGHTGQSQRVLVKVYGATSIEEVSSFDSVAAAVAHLGSLVEPCGGCRGTGRGFIGRCSLCGGSCKATGPPDVGEMRSRTESEGCGRDASGLEGHASPRVSETRPPSSQSSEVVYKWAWADTRKLPQRRRSLSVGVDKRRSDRQQRVSAIGSWSRPQDVSLTISELELYRSHDANRSLFVKIDGPKGKEVVVFSCIERAVHGLQDLAAGLHCTGSTSVSAPGTAPAPHISPASLVSPVVLRRSMIRSLSADAGQLDRGEVSPAIAEVGFEGAPFGTLLDEVATARGSTSTRTEVRSTVADGWSLWEQMHMRLVVYEWRVAVRRRRVHGVDSLEPNPKELACSCESDVDATKWTVESPNGLPARRMADSFSEKLGWKNCGDTVHGERQGDWLALSSEPGYMLVSFPDGTVLMSQEAPTTRCCCGFVDLSASFAFGISMMLWEQMLLRLVLSDWRLASLADPLLATRKPLHTDAVLGPRCLNVGKVCDATGSPASILSPKSH